MKRNSRESGWTRLAALVAGVLLCAGLLSYGITEEVPLGAVRGVVTMAENGRPLAEATVILTPLDEHAEYARPKVLTSKADGSFSTRNLPAGDYSVEVTAKAHSLEHQTVSVTEGGATVIELELKPQLPYLDLYTSQRVFTPSEEPVIEAHGFGPDPVISMEVVKLDLDAILQNRGIRQLVQRFRAYEKPEDPKKYGSVVRQVDHAISGRDAEGTFINYLKLPQLAEGFYWVRCSLGSITQVSYINVSRIALVTKSTSTKVLCYVADIATGEPVASASLTAHLGGVSQSTAVTGPDGTATFSMPADASQQPVVVAKVGTSAAVTDFYAGNTEGDGKSAVVCYTDRPIYRPGDEIQFKGILRERTATGYALPQRQSVDIQVVDPDDTPIETLHLPVSAHGTFFGRFRTSRESKPGTYRLVTELGGSNSDTTYVNVAAYRKPEYTVKVKSEKPFYVIGQKARATVDCEYYFGGPVAGAHVVASITRTPLYDWGGDVDEAADEGYEGEYGYGGGETIDQVEATTDANGRAVIEFETRPENDGDSYDTDYSYDVSVSVADAGDKYFEGSGSVKVMRGAFGLDAETSEYVAKPQQPIELTLRTYSHDGHKPLAGKQVRIVAGEERWRDNATQFIEQKSMTVTTGSDGVATVSYAPPTPGSTVFKAIARDDLGNEIVSRAYLYVEGGPSAQGKPVPKLTAKLDRKRYRVGDQAKLLIQSNHPGGSALVTVEGDEVLATRVVRLDGQTTIVPIAVTQEHAPNVSVNVAYVFGKQFSEASSNLIIDLKPRELVIEVKPDRSDVQPGDTVNYAIVTKDEAGKPVPAEVSLGVVDESIFAIQEDRTDILRSLYPRRSSRVTTSYSFPEIYLDGGDKGGGDIPVRSKFADTAFWAPAVQTNADGQASVSVRLPDNLTTWRATVVGATDDTDVGMATAKIRASKPLMIRLSMPAFLVQQDKQRLTATVTNNTGQDADVNVSIGGAQIWLAGSPTRKVRVAAGQPTTLAWTIETPLTGMASVTAKAWIDGGPSDGVRQTVEIKPHGREVIEQSAGEVSGVRRLTFSVRPEADRTTGRLVINVSPSIASSMVRSLDRLVGFPYGCVEQTMSRFMPSIIVDRTLTTLGVSRPDLKAKIPAIAEDGLSRLAKMQHYDGGWGWWENDQSDPFMTALVLDGLKRAADAGYQGNPSLAKRGLDWAEQRLTSQNVKKDSLRDRAYLVYALAAWGRTESANEAWAKLDFAQAQTSELAIGILSARLLGPNRAEAVETLYGQLLQKADRGATLTHWPEDPGSWGEENTGLALAAIATVHPDDPVLPSVVRYVMVSQRGEGWASTRDTSYVLIGLTEYLRRTKEAIQPPRVRVSLNGRPLGEHAFGGLGSPDWQIRLPLADLRAGDNVVELQTDAGQMAYYATDMRQSIVRDELGQLLNGNGLSISRTYKRMEVRRLEDGTMRLMPSEKPISEARPGDVIQCEIVVRSDRPREFIMIESPIPSNCRITERENPEYWDWWWSQTVVLDDRASFFARRLPAGEQVLKFAVRAESPGVGHALPTTVANMYEPSDDAATGEYVLRVNR